MTLVNAAEQASFTMRLWDFGLVRARLALLTIGRTPPFDIPNEVVYDYAHKTRRAMGVEGKDRAKVLEAGAASLSNQLGQAVLRLRKGYGLSLADLSQQSGVAKSIISQIERNETNPTLTTIWRLAHALDASIKSMLQGAEEGPFIEHLGRGTTPIFVSDDGCPARGDRLAEDRRLAPMVRFSRRSGGRARNRPRICAGRSSACRSSTASSRSRSADRRRRHAPARRCAIAATCPIDPQPEREAGACNHGVHPQGGDDGLTLLATTI